MGKSFAVALAKVGSRDVNLAAVTEFDAPMNAQKLKFVLVLRSTNKLVVPTGYLLA